MQVRNVDLEMKPLLREWWGFIIAAILMIVGGYFLFSAVWSRQSAVRWAGLAALICGYEVVMVRRSLPLNHAPDHERLLPTLGAANMLSLLRGLMLAAIGGFLFSPWPEGWLGWMPALLYLSAMIIDYCDGIVARVTGHITVLGEHLDVEIDALGMIIAPLLGVLYGQLPIWYLLVSAARYLFMGGVWMLNRQNKPMYDLTPSHIRRMMAGFQMGMLSIILMPVFEPPGTWIVATVFMTPLIVGFIRDWLVVSGAINPASESYNRVINLSERLFRQWLPVALRLLVGVLLISFANKWFIATEPNHLRISLGFLTCGLLIMMGTAVRVVSGLALLLMGFVLLIQGMSVITVVVGAAILLIMGPGKLALWQPEEFPLHRRFGGDEEVNVNNRYAEDTRG